MIFCWFDLNIHIALVRTTLVQNLKNSPGLGPGRVRSSDLGFWFLKNKKNNNKNNKNKTKTTKTTRTYCFCCCNCFLLFEPAHARAAVREPPGHPIVIGFHLVALFFRWIFWKFFFHKKTQNLQKRYQKYSLNSLQIWPWVDFLWFFVHPVFERPYSVFAIFHWFESLQTQEKHIKNTLKKIPVFYNDILSKKTEKSSKMTPKIIPKRGSETREAVLKRSWGTFGAAAFF